MKLIEDIKERFLGVNAELRKKAKKLETLKQSRDPLVSAPLTPEELADAWCGIVEAQGQKYPEKLAIMEKGIRHQPMYDLANSRHNILNPFGDRAAMSPEALCWLCGDMMKARIREAVKHPGFVEIWGGFDDAGPPLPERKKRIAELDREIGALEKEIGDIRQSAQTAIAALE